MRAITIVMGILLMGTGVWSFANSGVSFLALAFAIGLVMIADGTVEGMTYVFGMWMLFSGILRLVIVLNIDRTKKKSNFWWTFGTGLVCILAGLLGFFNSIALNMAVGELLGIFFIIQAVTTLEIGFHMPHAKSIK